MPLTQAAVRRAMLAAQGLLNPPEPSPTKEALLACIQQMGYLQIDTIQAVRRSQYLVLWSRLGDYNPAWLDELHVSRHLFEHYAHALCYIPIEDYPAFRGLMLDGGHTGDSWREWAEAHPEILQHVRSVIEAQGPVSSTDFDSATISTGWGDVKQEKLALTRMFVTGELMVAHREGFRRYYDLRNRILPVWDDVHALDRASAYKALVLRAVKALGVATKDWIASYYYLKKTGLSEILEDMTAKGDIELVQVEGWDYPAYGHPENRDMLQAAAEEGLEPAHTSLLSPFDPLVSDRERALALFGFDCRMESYLPAKDRQYGYFCLPILHNGKLVGRLVPKAHRREKRLEIRKIYLEPGVQVEDNLVSAFKHTLDTFCSWHELTAYEIGETDPPILKEALAG